jgi:hypothetical protein
MSFYKDISPFWRYFRDTLAFGLIARPGALAVLVHALARTLDTVRKDVLWARAQFVPPTAEEDYIPLHGDSRGAPRTRFDSAARYRLRVERAAAWHKKGGKNIGLPEILMEYGYSSGTIYNCRDDDPALWAHFEIRLLNPPADWSAFDVDTVFALANQYKPGRSVIRKIQFAKQHPAGWFAGAVAQTAVIMDHHVKYKEALPPDPAPLYAGAAAHPYVVINNFAG